MKKSMLSGMAVMATVAMTVGYLGVTTYAERDRDQGSLTPGQGGVDLIETAEGTGPRDVQCSRLGLNSSGSGNDFAYWGQSGGVSGFSSATTACNIGGETAQWISGSSGKHPGIGQNLYRLHDGKFEQIAMNWLKHSFCAVSESTCGSCAGTGCGTLGVGCADTYSSGHNANNGDLGPRSQFNPWPTESQLTPTHTDPHQTPAGVSSIRGKLQVTHTDIQGEYADARFFYEAFYITHDELYSLRHNNASHREVNISTTSVNTTGIAGGSGQASVLREPAIRSWSDSDNQVLLKTVDIPNDGRFWVGSRAYDNGDGTWDYEHAIYNMNSRRAAMSFEAMIPDSVTVSNLGFHDVHYHSGDTIKGDDWGVQEGAAGLKWATDSFAADSDANAIRWSTMYNFRYTANSGPTIIDHKLEMFMTGPGGDDVTFLGWGPSAIDVDCPSDADGSGDVGVDDLLAVILDWGSDGSGNGGDVDGSGVVDADDLIQVILDWGICD